MIFIAALMACSVHTHLCVSIADNDHQFKTAALCEPLRKKVEANTKALLKQVAMPGPFQTITVCRDKAEIDKVIAWLSTQRRSASDKDRHSDDRERISPKGEAPDGSD